MRNIEDKKLGQNITRGFGVMFVALLVILGAVLICITFKINSAVLIVLFVFGLVLGIIGFLTMQFPRKKYPFHRV